MKYEIRRATPQEEEECWDAEAPVWGDGDPTRYREQWKDHRGGEYWVLRDAYEGITVASVCFFAAPRFGLPEGSMGMASLLTRAGYRKQGYASFLMSQLTLTYRNTIFAWSEIDRRFYTQRGWRCLYRRDDAYLMTYPGGAKDPGETLQRF